MALSVGELRKNFAKLRDREVREPPAKVEKDRGPAKNRGQADSFEPRPLSQKAAEPQPETITEGASP
jgi:hypothetical protein